MDRVRERRRSTLLALLLTMTPAGPAAAAAGGDSYPPGSAPRSIHFHRLSNRDGLSQMTVGAIVQDRLGFMWLGTEEGLNRFDGLSFVVFRHDPNEPDSLPKGAIDALIECRSGELWIGTDVGGLARFDPVSERITRLRWSADASSPSAGITGLLEDSAGRVWVASRSGLHGFDPGSAAWASFRHDPTDPRSLSHDSVFDLAPAASGELWVATAAGLDRLDPATGRAEHFGRRPGDSGLGPGVVRRLHLDPAGTLWAGTWGGGLHSFDAATGRFKRFPNGEDPADNEIRSLTGRGGELWLGTQGRGLFRFDPKSERFEGYRRDDDDPYSLSGDSIFSLYEDASGDLWAGTWGYGVNRFDPAAPTFHLDRHHPGDARGLSHSSVRSLLEVQGSLWVGTHGGGLSVRAPGEQDFTRLPKEIAGDTVYALLEDSLGELWIGSNDGIDILGAERRHVRRYRHDPGDPESLGDDVVRCLLEDRSGTIWIGTRGAGLDRFDPATGGFLHYRHDPGDDRTLGSDRVYALLEDSLGDLWVGTSGGLAVRSPDVVPPGDVPPGDVPPGVVPPGVVAPNPGFRRHLNVPGDATSLRGDVVLSLFADRAGTIWIGTQGGGLNRFERPSGTFTAFTEADGLSNDVVYAITEDRLGRLWLGTNRGLSRFDPTAGNWASYDPDDGLGVYEFNTGAVVRTAGGTVAFGGVDGLVSFRPERFRANPNPPPVVVTAFEVFQQPLDSGPSPPYLESIELAARENFFSFELAALNFRRADKNRYAYRLEGLEEQWVDAGTRRFASYTSVPAGDYVFHVKAANADGVWNRRGASVRLAIAPPLWARWWAWLAYAAAALGSLGAFAAAYRRKVEQEREINRRLREVDRLKDDFLAKTSNLLEERTAELRRRGQLVDELESLNRTISHDLRNPLCTIKNFLGRALSAAEGAAPEAVIADLRRIDSAADHMDRLLNELVHYSRIGRRPPVPESVAVGELAQAARRHLAGVLEAAGFEVEIAPDLPRVEGEPALLLVVFESLLDNAARFAAAAESPRIEIGWRPASAETEVEIHVGDNGIGIAADYHELVFGLFERLSQETPGTGIGLALARRIIEAHGGRIWVESEGPGCGSTFRFTLPRDGGPADGARAGP